MSISVPFFAKRIEDHPFPNIYAWVCGPRIGIVMESDEYKPRIAIGNDPYTLDQMQHERENIKRMSFRVPLIEKVLEAPEGEVVDEKYFESGGMISFPFQKYIWAEKNDDKITMGEGMAKDEGVIPMYMLEDIPVGLCEEILEAIVNMDTILKEETEKGRIGIRPEEYWGRQRKSWND